MLAASTALHDFCVENFSVFLLDCVITTNDDGESMLQFPFVDDIIENCFVPVVHLVILSVTQSDLAKRIGSRSEVFAQLEAGIHFNFDITSCIEHPTEAIAEIWTGDVILFAIQCNTLRAICFLLEKIPTHSLTSPCCDLSYTMEHYVSAMLHPIVIALQAVLAFCARSSSSPGKTDFASDVAGMFRLMASLINRGLGVELVIQFLTDENLEVVQHLCAHFNSPATQRKVFRALSFLCSSIVRVLHTRCPLSNVYHTAQMLFSKYISSSFYAASFVENMLDVLGAHGCHLQRMKQKFGSTFGEVRHCVSSNYKI